MIAEANVEGKPFGREAIFSPKGMTVEDFFARSIGQWRSQRSSHNLAWMQYEAITSDIIISSKTNVDEEVVQLCKQNNISPDEPILSIHMSWEGESDWDEEEVLEGSATMSLLKDGERHGRLLRSVGYAETIPAIGEWEMTDDGVFVLRTFYDAAAAEERIWFASQHIRMRVSQIRSSSGVGIVTASFSTEVRRLEPRDIRPDRIEELEELQQR